MSNSLKILITGGAGFIGSNIAKNYIEKGDKVIIFDNLSRNRSQYNLNWLKEIGNFDFIKGDIDDKNQVNKLLENNKDIDILYHQAAQVAVVLSIKNPRKDFNSNALGTFNILEAVRKYTPGAIVIYPSTNKVYGELGELRMEEKNKRYEFTNKKYKGGINESHNLDFHSPYGCSKGAADQYVRDYARIFGLKTITFRQSCIYGYRQMGIEDQGWVAWFIIKLILGNPVTLFGTGKQVRDILFIDDLVNAYQMAIDNVNKTSGQIYNMGGGYKNSLSLLELIDLLEDISGNRLEYSFSNWRLGDQKIFITDTSRAQKDFGWEPKMSKREGIKKLYKWLKENRNIFK